MRGILLCLLTLLPVAAQDYSAKAFSRRPLTNENVITLAKAGFDELFIVERIRTSRKQFDTTAEGLVALKQAGVSEELIRAMAAHDEVRADPSLAVVDAAPVESYKITIERHWWGFRWVRVTR